MVALDEISGSLLCSQPKDAKKDTEAVVARVPSSYKPFHTFRLDKDKQYKQQYGDMYFLRLTKLKASVDQIASETWDNTVIGGERARKVERVLDVRQGELCWVAGTVYMEMPLKPNILEDVSKDRWISGPDPRQKYFSDETESAVMLEDDSGRIRLVGSILHSTILVTGTIAAVMGTENANGELEVIDLKFPDLAPQPDRWHSSKPAMTNGHTKVKKEPQVNGEDQEMADSMRQPRGNKIAIVSGLNFSSVDTSHATELGLLAEYLVGEALDPATQREVSSISRLLIAGNSVGADDRIDNAAHTDERKSHKKYGYDSSAYNALPSQLLDEFLADILTSIPVTLLPGLQDPANASFPQQPIHTAIFPEARQYAAAPASDDAGWLDLVTNPWEGEVEGWRVLSTGGQNVDDVFKYVGTDDRLGMMEAMCRWRCSAPTAPDTLWSYPFQEDEPFVMQACPHLYVVGCQPEFGTKVIDGPQGQAVRLIAVPSFSKTHELVLVDMETLDVSVVKISAS